LLVLVGACGDNHGAIANDAGALREVVALPAQPTRQLDLLFVVDNEASTLEHQLALASSLPALFTPISLGERTDLHVAAITPDLGTAALHGDPAPAIGGVVGGCVDRGDNGRMIGDASAPFLIDSADRVNHAGTLVDATRFALARGSTGCGFQQPLAAIRAAFANPLNTGFRRPDAALGIVVLSDEDDCSALDPSLFTQDTTTLGPLSHFRCTRYGLRCAEPDLTTVGPRTACAPDPSSTLIEDPADFVPLLTGLVTDPHRLAFGLIAASTDVAIDLRAPPGSSTAVPALAHSCTWLQNNTPVSADPPVRLAWLAAQLGTNATTTSICNDDLTSSAAAIGTGLRRAMGDPCVEDADDLTSCTAVDQLGGVETPLARCEVTNQTNCWELVTDPATCPNAAHARLSVHRASSAIAGTYTLLRC
jgi:hypothetical protein